MEWGLEGDGKWWKGRHEHGGGNHLLYNPPHRRGKEISSLKDQDYIRSGGS